MEAWSDRRETRWKHGVIEERLDDRSYIVEDSGGPRGVPHSENDDMYDNSWWPGTMATLQLNKSWKSR